MLIFPAIDLIGGQAVRLYKGDYAQKTVYNPDPVSVALDFKRQGAKQMHVVDLDGARTGSTENFEIIKRIKKSTDIFVEVGGGIRNIETIQSYVFSDIDRVVLGTAAVENEEFLKKAVEKFGDKIAVGADIKDGFVAVKGWTEKSALTYEDFFLKIEKTGVNAVICTDISKDGAMLGTNVSLYESIVKRFGFKLIASGGVSDMEDIKKLKALGVYGAIVGKAYYTGTINLFEAIEVAK